MKKRLVMAVALCLVAMSVFAFGTKEVQPAEKVAPANPRLRLATTTSTENSGLLGYLLPIFEEETGYKVDVVAVGTGAAIKLGENADADILLVHARAQEDAFMAAGHGKERRDVCYNDFIVLGPQADTAKLNGSASTAEAFSKIANGQFDFVSRADKSGTHTKELAIWKEAGITPSGAWYKEAGQGMEQVIIMTDNLQGYTLADRGTWIATRAKTSLKICFEGEGALLNPYGVITVNPEKNEAINAEGAQALLEWITSDKGQKLIADFKLDGETLFFPNYKK